MINYDEIAYKYDEMFGSNEFTDEDKLLFPIIKKETGLNPLHRVLDVGCGTGLCIDGLNIEPKNYLGIDPSIKMLEQAKLKYPKYNFLASTFEDLQLKEKFDVIISTYGSFAYVDPNSYEKLWDFLKPNGKFFLMFYTEEYAKYVYDVIYKESGHKAEIGNVPSLELLKHSFPSIEIFNKNWVIAKN